MELELQHKAKGQRLLSLDFMRGFIMFLLALEAAELYVHIHDATSQGSLTGRLIGQFFHNQWEGLNFWDLIQPAFMFMAGIAMAYSLTKQIENNVPWQKLFLKTLKRSSWLLFWGILKRVYGPNWFMLDALDLTDILTQLAFTSLVAFFLFHLNVRQLLIGCILILAFTEILYRCCHIPGFDNAYVQGENFGNWVDYTLFGQRSNSYVFINWLPTSVHTIAGVMVGKLFLTGRTIIRQLIISGSLLLTVGYGMDIIGITPIIKPIASSSFVIASLGYCLLMVALFYWLIDLRKYRKGIVFFQVLGMNSIFIYLFFDIIGRQWFNGYTTMILEPILSLVVCTDKVILIFCSISIFILEWLLCFFLYKRKIFFKV